MLMGVDTRPDVKATHNGRSFLEKSGQDDCAQYPNQQDMEPPLELSIIEKTR